MNGSMIGGFVAGGIGLVVLLLATILGFGVLPAYIDDQIIEQTTLTRDSDVWDEWADITLPITMGFYIFNVTNPDEFEAGEPPQVQEVGPYIYSEKRVKFDFNTATPGRVFYRQNITYFFEEEMSAPLKETDHVNIINIPFISTIAGIPDNLKNITPIITNHLLRTEKVIRRNVLIKELTFEGFDVSLYTNTLGLFLPLPEPFEGGLFGLYRGNNGSNDGLYEIDNGEFNDSENFGEIQSWNRKTTLGYWTEGSHCDKVVGSDGSIFPPFVDEDRYLDIFVTDICRSIRLTYLEEIEFMDIDGYRFAPPPDVFEDPRYSESNRCYCAEEEVENCYLAGAISLSTCQEGAPVIMSAPHFLDGASAYVNAFKLSPNPAKHRTHIDLEKTTGVVLYAEKRIQINLDFRITEDVKAMENISLDFVDEDYLVFPVLWIEEIAAVDEESADDLKAALRPVRIINVTRIVLIVVSVLLIAIGGFFVFRGVQRNKRGYV